MNQQIINRFLQGTIAVLFVAFAGQVGYQYWFNKPQPQVFAAWAFEPRNLAEAKGLAKDIVEVEVTKIERANDLVVRAPGEPGGIERLAIEVITMKVKGRMKGKGAKEIQVFRTVGIPVSQKGIPPMSQAPKKPKGASAPPKRATPFKGDTINIQNDVKYKKGESYVLMLRDGPRVRVKGRQVATKSLVNPSTRFRIDKSQRIQPVVPEGLGRPFKGQGLNKFRGTIQKTSARIPIKGKLPGQMIFPRLKLKPGMIRPRGIEPGGELGEMEMELGEMEVPTEGAAPTYEEEGQ